MAKKPASNLNSSVKITLDGEDYYLRPSMKAALVIEEELGNLPETIEALRSKPLTNMIFLIKAGLTRESTAEMRDNDLNLAEAVWRAGQNALIDPIIQFAMRTFNSGSDFDEEPVSEDDAGKNDDLHV